MHIDWKKQYQNKSVLCKLMYRLNIFSIEITVSLFVCVNLSKIFPRYTWKNLRVKNNQHILKEQKVTEACLTRYQESL